MPPVSSFSRNGWGNKISMGVIVSAAVVWFCLCTFKDLTKNGENDEKKDLKKHRSKKHVKNDDRKGISAGDLEAALEKKVTKDGDCISCRENLEIPKKKTPTKMSSLEGTPTTPATPATPTTTVTKVTMLPGLDSSYATIKSSPANYETFKPADSSFDTIKSDDGNLSWDKLSLPPTPKKNARDVPPTPSNSLTITLKNKKKHEPKSDSAATLSSDCKSEKDMEKTQDDL